MYHSTHVVSHHPSVSVEPARGSGARERSAAHDEAVHSNVELLLRRLRFYVELLDVGYHQAMNRDLLSRSLRTERIALGIDLPELDAVPLWSTRGPGGTICVPFVEFILGQIAEVLDALSVEIAPYDPSAAGEIEAARAAVAGALETTGADRTHELLLPRLRDVFVPMSTLEELCGHHGCLASVAHVCDRLLREELSVSAH